MEIIEKDNKNNLYKIRMVDFLKDQYLSSFIGVIIASALSYIIYADFQGDKDYILNWFTMVVVATLIRLIGIKLLLIKITPTESSKSLRNIEITYAFLLFFSGVVWGLTSFLFLSQTLWEDKVIVYIFTLSILIGGLFNTFSSKYSFVAYLFSIIGFYIIYHLGVEDKHANYMVFSLFIFGGFLLQISFKAHKRILNLMESIESNKVLTAQLLEKIDYEIELNEKKLIFNQNSRLIAIGELASGMAHEINNPLSILVLYIKSIKNKVAKFNSNDEKIIKLDNDIITMEKTTKRINKIIKSLTKLARDDEEEDLRECTNILEFVNESVRYVELHMKTHKIKFEFINENVKNECVYINVTAISQVLVNLLNNAIYQIKKLPQRWIKVTVKTENNKLILTLMDAGSGIDNDIKSKMFDSFFTTKPAGEGTGIGLSISKQIINKHDGNIEITDSQNTEFKITLPLSDSNISNCKANQVFAKSS